MSAAPTTTAPDLPALDQTISAQVQDQCRAVSGLCKAVTELHDDYAKVIAAGCMSPTLLQMVGERTAKLMEYLGDLLNGMDATTDEDTWMDPIFERAHAMFPAKSQAAPTTTAPAPVSDSQLADDVRVLRLTLAELEPEHTGYWLDEGDLMNALINEAPDGSIAPMQEAAYLYACRPDRIARVLRRLEQEMDARHKRLSVAIAAAHDNADPIDIVADHLMVSREEAAELMRAALRAQAPAAASGEAPQLPPLPEPADAIPVLSLDGFTGEQDAFTAAQMREYGAACVRAAAAAQAAPAAQPQWIPTSERLPGAHLPVLVAYRNSLGFWRRTRAYYMPARRLVVEWEENYDEDEAGTTWHPEGWWEDPVEGEEVTRISDAVSHWMPLPRAPQDGGAAGATGETA